MQDFFISLLEFIQHLETLVYIWRKLSNLLKKLPLHLKISPKGRPKQRSTPRHLHLAPSMAPSQMKEAERGKHWALQKQMVQLAGSDAAARGLFKSLVQKYPGKPAEWYYCEALEILRKRQEEAQRLAKFRPSSVSPSPVSPSQQGSPISFENSSHQPHQSVPSHQELEVSPSNPEIQNPAQDQESKVSPTLSQETPKSSQNQESKISSPRPKTTLQPSKVPQSSQSLQASKTYPRKHKSTAPKAHYLFSKIVALTKDEKTAQRLLNAVVLRYPDKDSQWQHEKVIFDLERDRH